METALTGMVRQEAGGTPIAGARLGVEWEVFRRLPDGWRSTMHVDSAATDYRGRYRFCGLPAEVGLQVQATFPGFESPKIKLELSMSETRALDLLLVPDSMTMTRSRSVLDPVLPEPFRFGVPRENLIRPAGVDVSVSTNGPWSHDFLAPSGLPGPYRHGSITRLIGS